MNNHGKLNQEYDNQSLNWEDHFGLCDKVTYLMCHFNGDLQPHYRDIEIDLRAKLWECLQPGKFDPTRGIRVSTYVCRAMIREYNRICNLYLGYSPRNKYKHRNVVSLSTPTGEDYELVNMIGVEVNSDEQVDRRIDTSEMIQVLADIVGEDRVSLVLEYYRGHGSRNRAHHARKMMRKIVQQEQQDDPKLIEQLQYTARAI